MAGRCVVWVGPLTLRERDLTPTSRKDRPAPPLLFGVALTSFAKSPPDEPLPKARWVVFRRRPGAFSSYFGLP